MGHWIDVTGDWGLVIVWMDHWHGPHTHANQTNIIWKLPAHYGLRCQVGHFTTNNATNNYTSMREHVRLFSDVIVAFNQVWTLMQCFRHIINLVEKTFLYGQNADAVAQQLGALDNDVDATQKLQLWPRWEPFWGLYNMGTWMLHFP